MPEVDTEFIQQLDPISRKDAYQDHVTRLLDVDFDLDYFTNIDYWVYAAWKV